MNFICIIWFFPVVADPHPLGQFDLLETSPESFGITLLRWTLQLWLLKKKKKKEKEYLSPFKTLGAGV